MTQMMQLMFSIYLHVEEIVAMILRHAKKNGFTLISLLKLIAINASKCHAFITI